MRDILINNKGLNSKKIMEPEIVGAIKIKDGLFIGDEFAAQVLLCAIIIMLRTWNLWWQIRLHILSIVLDDKFLIIGNLSECNI